MNVPFFPIYQQQEENILQTWDFLTKLNIFCATVSHTWASLLFLCDFIKVQIFWEDCGIFQIGFMHYILQLCIPPHPHQKLLGLIQSLTYSLLVLHIQSVNLRWQWLQHCKWTCLNVLKAKKIQAVKQKGTVWIGLLLAFVARFLLESLLVG